MEQTNTELSFHILRQNDAGNFFNKVQNQDFVSDDGIRINFHPSKIVENDVPTVYQIRNDGPSTSEPSMNLNPPNLL
ncbi:294_t:CDS:2 [Ambispora gerdemannii]|uniref:294_t:CDS:1 n=1 Tax=Ambispora gerdemannii TaxID=144530 RepID=A0A9N8ZJH6_9GLOM|nr:294_t:CDS:2 [Ambispora gerdemannii]